MTSKEKHAKSPQPKNTLSRSAQKLQDKVNKSPFQFGVSSEPFVPVYGPFAWKPDEIARSKPSVSNVTSDVWGL